MKFLFILFSILRFSFALQGQDITIFHNPYEVVYNHLAYLQDDNYDASQSALSFPLSIDSSLREDASIKLKRIYDGMGLYVHVSRIPKDINYIDSLSGENQFFPFPKLLPEIYVEKSTYGWAYSVPTFDNIQPTYKRTYPYGLHALMDLAPADGGKKFLGLYSWQWISLLVAIPIIFLLYYILSKVFTFIIFQLSKSRLTGIEDYKQKLEKIDSFLALAIVLAIFNIILPLIRLPIKFSVMVKIGLHILTIVCLMLFFLGIVEIVKKYLEHVTSRTSSKLDEQLLPILVKFLKIFIVMIAVLRILHLLDVNVTALIAGVSIGGLALALAAQDTVKNLIGSMMIFFDKPFQIGDYITGNDIEGSVVEVGFRSTRIQNLDTSITTVPNGNIVNASLTNLGARKLRVVNLNLGIEYNSPSSLIQLFIDDLKKFTSSHPKISPNNQMVYLKSLGDSSINIMYRCFIETNEYEEELAIKQDIYFNILQIAESNQISFAFPSSSVYIESIPENFKKNIK